MSNPAAPTPERFFTTITAYQQSAALKAAIDLGLFTAIAESARNQANQATADDIAQRCKIAPRGARILADYLTLSGFLNKSQTSPPTYTLSEDSALFLDR